MKANKELSKLFPDIEANDKECWNNALEAVIATGDPEMFYVEGWAVTDYGLATEHGWIEYRGEVLEITPSWQSMEKAEYFPGVKLSRLEALKALAEMQEDEEYPFVRRDGFYGLLTRNYVKAMLDAHGHAGWPLSEGQHEHIEKHFPELLS